MPFNAFRLSCLRLHIQLKVGVTAMIVLFGVLHRHAHFVLILLINKHFDVKGLRFRANNMSIIIVRERMYISKKCRMHLNSDAESALLPHLAPLSLEIRICQKMLRTGLHYYKMTIIYCLAAFLLLLSCYYFESVYILLTKSRMPCQIALIMLLSRFRL